MLKLMVPFGLGVLVGRSVTRDRPRPAGRALDKAFRVTMSRRENAVTDADVAQAQRVARILEDAIDALLLAYRKVSAGLRERPLDKELNGRAEELEGQMSGLRTAFWELHAKRLAEKALQDMESSTAELQQEAAKLPNATKVANKVAPVISASGKVGAAVKKAGDTATPAESSSG